MAEQPIRIEKMFRQVCLQFILHLLLLFIGKQCEVYAIDNEGTRDMSACSVCDCSSVGEYQFVNCSSRNLTILPPDMPSNTMKLDFSQNMIATKPQLPSSLKYLYGNGNKLTDIFDMFNNTTHIKVINLVNNSISSIPKDTFASCRELTTLKLNNNPLEDLSAESFRGLKKLRVLFLRNTSITAIKGDLFREVNHQLLFNQLQISSERLSNISRGALNFSIADINVSTRNLIYFPSRVFAPENGEVRFMTCKLKLEGLLNISSRAFQGVRSMNDLTLEGTKLKRIPEDLLKHLSLVALYLQNNDLQDLPDEFLQSSSDLTTLSLYGNRLTTITKDILKGLTSLKTLFLFRNQLTDISPLTFLDTNLAELYLFDNKITHLKKEALKTRGCTLTNVFIYYNDLCLIDEGSFDCLEKKGSEVYYSVECLRHVPYFPPNVDLFCVGDNINNSVPNLPQGMKVNMKLSGFECDEFVCVPCKPGTYDGDTESSCIDCPPGGYYQDRSGQKATDKKSIGCNVCTNGTYVHPNRAPGASALACQICPEGTNKTRFAGFRACHCLEGYYRKDRFGPCVPCPEQGIDCTYGYQKLEPGSWWTWDFNGTRNESVYSIDKYKAVCNNLETYNWAYNPENNRFDGALPRAFPCLRGIESCPRINGIDDPCGDGYEGWVCSRCSSGYYSWFEYCIKCPKNWHLILEISGVVLFICIVVAITVWDIKRRSDSSRTLVDILVARFKIVLGYYQITGAIFTSLHNIHWPHQISKLASVFEVLELNIFKLVAKPRCFNFALELNIYNEFIIGVSFCCFIVIVPVVIYSLIWLYIQFKISKHGRLLNHDKVQNYLKVLRSKCNLFSLLILFIVYLSVCDVILSLMPITCREFCVDERNEYCHLRLKSDYSIDCKTQEHNNYLKAAYAGLAYIVGFPLLVLFLVLKNSPRKLRAIQGNHETVQDDNVSLITNVSLSDNDQDDENSNVVQTEASRAMLGLLSSENTDAESVASEDSLPSHRSDAHTQTSNLSVEYPLHIRFLCESYKPQYWYWEIVELSRKVLQTSLVVLYGSEDPLTLGATIALSVVYLTTHAYFKPMKDAFEHWLQMTSLMAIFLNLLCAEVLLVPWKDSSADRQTAMAVLIIVLNVSVVFLALGNAILIVWQSVKKFGLRGFCSCRNCLIAAGGILSGISNACRRMISTDVNPAAV